MPKNYDTLQLVFGSRLKNKYEKYVSWLNDPDPIAENAFTCYYRLFSLILKILRKWLKKEPQVYCCPGLDNITWVYEVIGNWTNILRIVFFAWWQEFFVIPTFKLQNCRGSNELNKRELFTNNTKKPTRISGYSPRNTLQFFNESI